MGQQGPGGFCRPAFLCADYRISKLDGFLCIEGERLLTIFGRGPCDWLFRR